jgi:TRAP-type C4-dicarboxylate transport system permease small subunit|tara:strand:- start:34 stop:576 length:543 start_codon:yes stop_codon:yes gene_type:complete
MIATIRKIAQAVDIVARLASIFLVLAVLLIMSGQVFFRYVLNSSLQWSEEASIWAMIWMVFIGSVVVMRNWEHIYIPTVIRLFPLKIRIWLIVLSHVLVGIFLSVLVWYGWQVVTGSSNAFSHNIGVSSAWAKASVPLGAAMMMLMVIAELAEDIAAIASKDFSRFAAFGATDPAESPEI